MEFHSREFAGLKIAKQNQNYGTLLKLEHGLLLEPADDSSSDLRKTVLMPHGRVGLKHPTSNSSTGGN